MPPRKKSASLAKLKKLLPKRKVGILNFDHEPEQNIHWVFGILLILVIIFILGSTVFAQNTVQHYLSLLK
jgi:hypothetical protein